MKAVRIWTPLLAVFFAIPATAHAQDDCPCRRPGIIGVTFTEVEGGVRIADVRRDSPAEAAGVRVGDGVVLVDGIHAAEGYPVLPRRLQAGDTVRLRVVRPEGERDIAIVAAPRPPVVAWSTPALVRGGRMVTPDSLERPLRELTIRLDSLHSRLLRFDSAGARVRIDSMVRILSDSANVFVERMPRVHVEMLPAQIQEIEIREGAMRQMETARALAEGTAVFVELGRRAAAGAELAPMNEGLARYFGGQRTGALVVEVGPGTPAERAGLQPGDVIVRAAGETVETPADLRRHLTGPRASVQLQVIRQGRRRDLTLEWEDRRQQVERVIRERGN